MQRQINIPPLRPPVMRAIFGSLRHMAWLRLCRFARHDLLYPVAFLAAWLEAALRPLFVLLSLIFAVVGCVFAVHDRWHDALKALVIVVYPMAVLLGLRLIVAGYRALQR